MNPKRFATMVVLDQDNSKVLLILREDFRIWGLPGGMLEAGETPEHGAIRETLEETGFETEIVRFCGTHFRPRMNDLRYIFLGKVTGGQALDSGPETLALRWFNLHQLPEKTTPHLRVVVQDALNTSGEPFEKVIHMSLVLVVILRLMVGLRDLRNRLTGRA